MTKKGEKKKVNLNVANNLLLRYTVLKNARIYHRMKLLYTYNYKRGFYDTVFEKEFITLIYKVMAQLSEVELTENGYLDQIYKEIKVCKISRSKFPETDYGYVAFTNQVLHLQTRKFSVFNPRLLLLCCVYFPYLLKTYETPVLNAFLKDFSSGFQDRKKFVIALLYAIIFKRSDLQFFPFMFKPGASGKSVLINLASALVKHSSTITTTLKNLNQDQFQVLNFLRKKLVVITNKNHISTQHIFLDEKSYNLLLARQYDFLVLKKTNHLKTHYLQMKRI